MSPPNGGAAEFWAKVKKTKSCWIWTGKITAYGYGVVRRRWITHNEIKAHRYAWILSYGEIPQGLFVLHRCDVRNCVNPKHLFIGTQRDNAKDMWNKGRAKPTPSLGSKHGNAKLMEVQVVQIRKARRAGETLVALSRQFKVTAGNIGHIVNGRAWNHV